MAYHILGNLLPTDLVDEIAMKTHRLSMLNVAGQLKELVWFNLERVLYGSGYSISTLSNHRKFLAEVAVSFPHLGIIYRQDPPGNNVQYMMFALDDAHIYMYEESPGYSYLLQMSIDRVSNNAKVIRAYVTGGITPENAALRAKARVNVIYDRVGHATINRIDVGANVRAFTDPSLLTTFMWDCADVRSKCIVKVDL